MKITMYELLGMIKDGKAPKKIKYKNYIYEYQHRRDTLGCFNYMCNENGEYLSRRHFIDNILNDEIEILEEEKKIPEKIPGICACSDFNENEEKLAKNINILKNKYNEIIDYLQSKGDE